MLSPAAVNKFINDLKRSHPMNQPVYTIKNNSDAPITITLPAAQPSSALIPDIVAIYEELSNVRREITSIRATLRKILSFYTGEDD